MIKKLNFTLSIFLSFVLLISILTITPINVQADDQYFSGAGTVDSPYVISTAGDLQQLAVLVNAGNTTYSNMCYKMVNDINLSGIGNWTPINSFNGVFDGGGHKIIGLNISVTTDSGNYHYIGMFLTNNGTIQNLGIIDSNIQALKEGDNITGSIAGQNNGTISYCYNTGNVTSIYAGGIAGTNYGTLANCYNKGAIVGIYAAGGIAAINNSTLSDCYNGGTITSSKCGGSGGIAAINQGNADINNCYNTGTVVETNSDGAAGGIVSENTGGKISDCYNIGTITLTAPQSYTMKAGICAYNESSNSAISNCYYVNNVPYGVENGNNKSITVYSETLAHMQVQQTFSGFDFTNTWVMPEEITTTPLLRSLYVPLTNISLKDTTLIKNKKAYILQPVPEDASFTDCTWSSSNTNVATVDANGIITALNFGRAFIFATSKQGAHSAYCVVTVTQGVESVTLPAKVNVLVNNSTTLNPTILPTNAFNKNILWSSSNPKIASVDENGNVTGLLPGTSTITAAALDGSGKSAQCTVTVIRPVTGIVLGSSASSLLVGKTLLLSAMTTPDDASNQSIIWTTSDPSVATVDNNGYVLGTGRGSVTITATTADGGFSGSWNLQVIQPVTSITLNEDTIGMEPGTQFKLNPTVLPTNANDSSITWTSTDENVGTVSDDGTVSALTEGVAMIVAHSADGQAVAHCAVLVGDTPFNDLIKTKISDPKTQSTNYNSLSLSWTPIQTATGYEVYSSETPNGNYVQVGQCASTKTLLYNKLGSTLAKANNQTITISGLMTGKPVYFKVRGYIKYNGYNIYSKYSDPIVGNPTLSTPSSVKAISSGYNSINLSWSAVSGASGYQVYKSSSSTGNYVLAATTASTSYKDNQLITNSTYYYKVRAYRLVGTTKVYSGYSTIASSKPILSVPANCKAVRYSSTSNKLTWGGVSGATGYEIYRSTSSTGTYSLIKTTTYLYYINTGLTKGRTYYYKLRAYRIVGKSKVYSNWSVIVYAKPY